MQARDAPVCLYLLAKDRDELAKENLLMVNPALLLQAPDGADTHRFTKATWLMGAPPVVVPSGEMCRATRPSPLVSPANLQKCVQPDAPSGELGLVLVAQAADEAPGMRKT
jgi:hypothetical protein